MKKWLPFILLTALFLASLAYGIIAGDPGEMRIEGSTL